MSSSVQSIDVSESPELLELAEDVQQSGVARLLMNGEKELALLSPVDRHDTKRRRKSKTESRDSLLDIIGIGASEEPTDIARFKREYLAEAAAPSRE
jgi:hypothetical protein